MVQSGRYLKRGGGIGKERKDGPMHVNLPDRMQRWKKSKIENAVGRM